MKSRLIVLLGVVVVLLKLFIIDMDPPVWKISLYQPVDEPYYVNNAYNYFESKTFFDDAIPSINSAFLTNLITYFSLEVFGDNYFGLRFSSLLFGLFSLIIFFFLLKNLTDNNTVKLAAVLFFSLNFAFTTANLVVEPTIARMTAALLALWLVLQWHQNNSFKTAHIVWQSAIIFSLFIFVYPTNAFLVLAAYLGLIPLKYPFDLEIFQKKWLKGFFIESIYFALGIFLALFFYFLIIESLGGDLLRGIKYRASSYESRTTFGLKELILNTLKLVLANSFRFNPLWLLLSVLSVVGVFISKELRKSKPISISLIFIISFVAQSAFVNDFPWRKLIILLPFLLLVAIYGLEIVWKRMASLKIRWSLAILLFSLTPSLLLLYWERDFYNSFSLYSISILTTGSAVLMIVFSILFKPVRKITPFVVFCLLLLPEIVFTAEHYFIKKPYNYKEAYKALSVYDDHQFIGGTSKGFRIYNSIIPVLSKYDYYGKTEIYWEKAKNLSLNGRKDYSIGYDFEKELYKAIGFKPLKVILSAEESVWKHDLVLYEEIEVN